jgi:RNA polymerase sigma-70 factor, ECF subfamily
MANEMRDITGLLQCANQGDSQALESLIPLVYGELKRLAASYMRRERDQASMQTTALVHEAYLRMTGMPLANCENRSHFYGIAARIMRQILVDQARARHAAKRTGEVLMAEVPDVGSISGGRFLELNEAIDRLTAESPVKGQLIELRYFAGLTAEQSADALEMPVNTVRKELRLAIAWLHSQLA